MNEKVIPGRYRHYKGKEYTVIGVALHSETQEELVVYRQEYGDHGLWVRPKNMFLETVEVEGQQVPRFRFVGGQTDRQQTEYPSRMEAMSHIKAIIETAIYVDDLQAAEAFYGTILGLRVLGKEPGHHVFFQVGASSILLAFIADATLKGDHLPAHGARGPGHFALGIETETLDAWRRRLQESSVAIEQEVEWPRAGKSIYCRDPAGNLVELITPGIWGLPGGW
jgi:catechol 2,3-dioxygenase-like lactoylglutathione lyase family enzyme